MNPVAEHLAVAGDYRPVVRAIKSRLIHIAEPDDPGAPTAGAHPSRVGVVPLGLADGYQTIRPDAQAYALLGGCRVRITGVALEYILLDLSDFDEASVGDEIVLLGKSGSHQIRLADIASWQGSPPHATLLAFEGRLQARYLDDGIYA